MKALFVPTLNSPSVYYRMEMFVNYLRAQGHEVAFRYRGPDFSGSCLWEHNVMDVKDQMSELWMEADIIVSQIVHTRMALALMALLKDKYKKPFLVELDDDPYAVPHSMLPGHGVPPGSERELWGDELIARADGVICTTEHIKTRVQERYPHKPVHVIPNCLDFSVWDKLRNRERKRPVAGWIGGANHIRDLKMLQWVIPGVPKVAFHIYSGALADPLLAFGNVKQVHMAEKVAAPRKIKGVIWWKNILEYPAFLASLGFTVGLFPLCDTTINRSKSNLRWLEYSALEIPTIASRVGAYAESIVHGETGLLCGGTHDWVEAIQYLVSDKSAREKMGRKAREIVREHASLDVRGPLYEAILKEYING